MRYNFDKDMRIIRDMITYCHDKGATDYHIDLTSRNSTTYITVRSSVKNLSKDDLSSLKVDLDLPRQLEVEQNFWGLSGEMEDCNLSLIGMMIDEAEIHYDDNVLTINAMRKEY